MVRLLAILTLFYLFLRSHTDATGAKAGDCLEVWNSDPDRADFQKVSCDSDRAAYQVISKYDWTNDRSKCSVGQTAYTEPQFLMPSVLLCLKTVSGASG